MKYIILVAIASLILSSCSKNLVPYSQKMKENYGWSKEDVQRIQFYTSNNIVLQRKVTHGKTEIISGKIKIVDGKEVEEIIIRKGTKGVAVWFPSDQRIGVSFELSDDHYLTFGPNPKRGRQFYLFASDWNNRIGKVTYNGQTYFTAPDSELAYLMVNLKQFKKWDVDQRVVKGRTVTK